LILQSFILLPSSFFLLPSSFDPSSFILHPSSFFLRSLLTSCEENLFSRPDGNEVVQD